MPPLPLAPESRGSPSSVYHPLSGSQDIPGLVFCPFPSWPSPFFLGEVAFLSGSPNRQTRPMSVCADET